MRNISVGVDVMVYEYDCFYAAKRCSSFIDYCEQSELEFVFKTINWIAASVSDHISAAFFLIEFLFLSMGYAAACRMRNYSPIWMSMLIFMLCYYNLSFNLMRQMIAMAYLAIAFTYLYKDNRTGLFFLLLILAMFFHKTATMAGLFFWAIILIYNKKKAVRKTLAVAYGLGCLIIAVIFKTILSWVALLGGRFADYVIYGGDGGGDHFKPTLLTILILGDFMLLFLIAIAKYNNISDHKTLFVLLLLVVTDIMAQFLGLYTGFATRMSCYFCMPYMFLLPNVFSSDVMSLQTKFVMRVLLCVAFIIIWLRMVGMTGNTIPYKSEILGI
ncbi:MAG: EpsG family protein [Bacteroidales bacterium]|nr:EpsG family protein [Bacteroidales bacterium]